MTAPGLRRSRSAVVTGSGAGIGLAVARRLLEDGWFVVAIERSGELAQQNREEFGSAAAVVDGDVADNPVLQAGVEAATQRFPLRAWVNNAAVALAGNLHEPDPDAVRRVFSVNLEAVFWGCSAAVRAFLSQRTGGSIVNISSIQAQAAFPGWAAYVAAKGGVEALTRYVAVEYGPAEIRCNAVAPGNIRTPLAQKVIADAPDPAQMERDMAVMQPIQRMGEPQEVAAVVSFLASDEASLITGQILNADGGATARCYAMDPDPFVAAIGSARRASEGRRT